ncbi:MAG: RelA/SpoT family protein [Cytophagales bacterium]|nr:RelA/SpoT family protein [Cytophagales bacterium]
MSSSVKILSADDQPIQMSLEEEKQHMIRLYRSMLSYARDRLSSQDIKDVKRAFVLASEAHEGMRRRSGEPYMYHPLEVARICAREIHLTSATTLISCLLHDVVEDTDLTLEDLAKRFEPAVINIIGGLTKISTVFEQGTSEQAENFRKVLLTLSSDVRVILIKLADRLHNMRTLHSLPRRKRIRIASETMYLYAPLAHRMGLHVMKSELEDLCLKYTEPDGFRYIAHKLKQTKVQRDRFIKKFIQPIKKALSFCEINYPVVINGRTKSIYSIWSKMKKQRIPFKDIYDLFALRIVIDVPEDREKELCWQIYSLVTDIYKPNPDRLRDWISTPKSNGYESLHTTVMSGSGQWVEVQIRSCRMDEIAERGYAAHWRYKEQTTDSQNRESMLDHWLLKVRGMLENKIQTDAVDFVQDFRSSLQTREVYAFTPKGRLCILSEGATVLDFAFEVHTEIGKTCIGGKVNHQLQPLNYKLKNGDQIEILSSSQQRPQEAWLKFLATSKARNAVRQSLEEERRELVERGKHQVREHLFPITKGENEEKDMKKLNNNLDKLVQYFQLSSEKDLYHQVGEGKLPLSKLAKIYEQLIQATNSNKKTPEEMGNSKKAMILGLDSTHKHGEPQLAPCCHPLPGDEVFGVKTYEGVKIHRNSCKNAPELLSQHGDQIVWVEWNQDLENRSMAVISLRGFDRRGMTRDIMQVISVESEINAQSVYLNVNNSIFEGEVKLYINGTERLNRLLDRLSEVKGVVSVVRSD